MTRDGLLLAVDIGNTRTRLGLFTGSEPVEQWLVSTDPGRTADEWAGLVGSLLAPRYGALDAVTGVAIAPAVPSVLHEWREMVQRHLPEVPCVVVGPGVRTSLAVRMDNPREVGADRIVNALAAANLHSEPGRPVAVLSFATATTIEVVDASGAYVGGLIAPGIEVSAEALARRTAQLRRVELARPRSVIAKNTVEAIQSGLYFGVLAQVEGLLARVARELEVPREDLRVVATGYLAPLVLDECSGVDAYDELLTLRGLELLYRRNAG